MSHYLKSLLILSLITNISCAMKQNSTSPSHGKRVVLVHGFLDTTGCFKTLRRRLEKHGFDCYVPSLKPSDGRGGLEDIATKLKQDINTRFGPTAPISVVGFSMGGLVSRQYLQVLDGSKRCENFITVSSPHHGTFTAFLYPSLGAKQMRPGSRFLANLRDTQDRLVTIPTTSYRTPLDLMILPSSSSIWDCAENLEFPVLMHPLMLTSNQVLSDIEQRLMR